MYTSQYYTNPEIDERLLQGYYDDALAVGFTGSKTDFHQVIIKARNISEGVNDIDSLHSIADLGTYLYTGFGWKGLVNVNFDASNNVSQVVLSSSTPSYENDSLTWISGKPCVMVRTYTNGAWSAWSKAGADVVNDLVTGGTEKALSAEQGKILDQKIGQLGPKIDQFDVQINGGQLEVEKTHTETEGLRIHHNTAAIVESTGFKLWTFNLNGFSGRITGSTTGRNPYCRLYKAIDADGNVIAVAESPESTLWSFDIDVENVATLYLSTESAKELEVHFYMPQSEGLVSDVSKMKSDFGTENNVSFTSGYYASSNNKAVGDTFNGVTANADARVATITIDDNFDSLDITTYAGSSLVRVYLITDSNNIILELGDYLYRAVSTKTINRNDLPDGAKYIYVNFWKSSYLENPTALLASRNYVKTSTLAKFNDDYVKPLVENFTGDLVNDIEAASENVAGYVKNDGEVSTQFTGWFHDVYAIDEIVEGATYTLYTSFDGGSGVPRCVFFNGETFLGYEEMSSGETTISIPNGTTLIKVNKHPSSVETYIKVTRHGLQSINMPSTLNEINQNITELSSDVEGIDGRLQMVENRGTESRMPLIKFTKTNDYFYIRTSLNDTQDLVIKYSRNPNGFIDQNAAYVGLKSRTTASIASSTKMHNTNDSAAPINTNNYWYIGGQHGYLIPKVTSDGHDKTADDIGSKWADSGNREYTLVGISESVIYLSPTITIGSDGIGVNPWNRSLNMGSTLTHISGAVHTSSITIDSQSNEQIHPACMNIEETISINGMNLEGNVTDLECQEVVYKVIYDVKDPAQATSVMPFESSPFVRIIQTFRFIGMSCSVNQTFRVVGAPVSCVNYGATQPLGLTKYGNYNSYTFIPKVAALTNNGTTEDWKYPHNTGEADAAWNVKEFLKNSSCIEDLNNLPERFVQYYEYNASKLIGFASGLSLVSSHTQQEHRNLTIPVDGRVNTFARDGRNKLYFYILNSINLPLKFTANFNYYQCYFDPNASDALVYWYKDGNSWVVYVHNFAANDSAKIALPSFMEGMTATLIEKSSNAELLTDTVVDGEMFAKFADSNAAYIVYKLT